MYFLGDLNLELNKLKDKSYYLKKIAEEYESLIGNNGLEIFNFNITWQRIFSDGTIKESSLDHLVTNNPNSVVNWKNVEVTFSDHSLIIAELALVKQKIKKQQRFSRDLRKIRRNPQRFLIELAKIDWARLLRHMINSARRGITSTTARVRHQPWSRCAQPAMPSIASQRRNCQTQPSNSHAVNGKASTDA